MNENYNELKEDFIKLADVGWDCSCGRGWYNIEESETELWRILVKYGLKEDSDLPTKYYFRNKSDENV